MVGFLGLLWGQCFHGRLGPAGVMIYVVGYGLIIVGGLALVVTGTGPVESPLFLIFPIGGLLQDVGYLLFGIATISSARWQGWQRWAPLLAAAVGLLAIGLPMLAGIIPILLDSIALAHLHTSTALQLYKALCGAVELWR